MKSLYLWLIEMYQNLFAKGGLPAETEEKKKHLLKLDIQMFAGDNDPGDDDPDNDDPDDGDDMPDLDELLKDPKFKKQYNARFKEQLGKRLKKFDGVDPDEYKRLKEQADKGKSKKQDNPDDELTELQQLQQKEERLLRAERREKRAMVKEFAADNGHNPKLLARLINVDDIELNEDGEPENLDELFEELEEEFPEYFGSQDDDEDERPKKRYFIPGSKQKGNSKKKVDPREAGRQKALERHRKKED